MLSKRWSIGGLLAIALVVAACGSDAVPSIAPSLAAPATPTSGASASPSVIAAAASPSAVTPAPTLKPARTPRPTARATPTPIAWTDNEDYLKGSIREDAAVGCAPRRSNLPPRAIAGVECRPREAFVERVGAYLFPTPDSMLQTYQDRMDDYDVSFDAGNCAAGVPTDTSWGPSFAPDDEAKPWARAACYLDENGAANLRITCDNSIYIGVLGDDKDMARLYNWAMRTADTPSYEGSGIAPGICGSGFEVY